MKAKRRINLASRCALAGITLAVLPVSLPADPLEILDIQVGQDDGFGFSLFHATFETSRGLRTRNFAISLNTEGANTPFYDPDTGDLSFTVDIWRGWNSSGSMIGDPSLFMGTATATSDNLEALNFGDNDGSFGGSINWIFDPVDESRLDRILNNKLDLDNEATTSFLDLTYTGDANSIVPGVVEGDDSLILTLWGATGLKHGDFPTIGLGTDLRVITSLTPLADGGEVPEPGEILLLALGGIGLIYEYRRRRAAADVDAGAGGAAA